MNKIRLWAKASILFNYVLVFVVIIPFSILWGAFSCYYFLEDTYKKSKYKNENTPKFKVGDIVETGRGKIYKVVSISLLKVYSMDGAFVPSIKPNLSYTYRYNLEPIGEYKVWGDISMTAEQIKLARHYKRSKIIDKILSEG